MAEEIRRRVAALRLAALLAVAVTLAGLTTRDAPRPVSAAGVPADSVGSRQVIDGSLKFRDFKQGAVLAPWQAENLYLKLDDAAATYLDKFTAAETYLDKFTAADTYLHKVDAADTYLEKQAADSLFLKITDAAESFLKITDATETFLSKTEAASDYLSKIDAASDYLSKIDAASDYLSKIDAASDYLSKIDAASDYLSKIEADADYWKIGDEVDAHKLGGLGAAEFVQGTGTVLSGMVQLDAPGAEADLVELPGLVRLSVTHGSEAEGKETVSIANVSEGPLLVSYDGQALQMGPDGLLQILIGLNQPSLVQIVDLGKSTVSTVTVGATQVGPEQELLFTGQALVGGR